MATCGFAGLGVLPAHAGIPPRKLRLCPVVRKVKRLQEVRRLLRSVMR